MLRRQVKAATLNLVAEQARRLGGRRLLGRYLPTKKNAMVQHHYAELGFTPIEQAAAPAWLPWTSPASCLAPRSST